MDFALNPGSMGRTQFYKCIRKAFDKYDKDRSGALDRAEFEVFLKDIAKTQSNGDLQQSTITTITNMIDANNDNEIQFEEVCDNIDVIIQLMSKRRDGGSLENSSAR
jgi:Ca2+-binding EF-hand superfamily protein